MKLVLEEEQVSLYIVLLKDSSPPPPPQKKKENMLKIHSSPAIQDVDDFVSSSEQIWRNLAYVTCSPVDPLQWMGAVRMRVQTAEVKNCTFVKNTSIKSIIHNKAVEKSIPCFLSCQNPPTYLCRTISDCFHL